MQCVGVSSRLLVLAVDRDTLIKRGRQHQILNTNHSACLASHIFRCCACLIVSRSWSSLYGSHSPFNRFRLTPYPLSFLVSVFPFLFFFLSLYFLFSLVPGRLLAA